MKNYYVYVFGVLDEMVYYGKGKPRYGKDKRGRVEQHYNNLRMTLAGTLDSKRHFIYAPLAAESLKGKIVTHRFLSEHDVEVEAYASEQLHISQHARVFPEIKMLNRMIDGTLYSEAMYEDAISETLGMDDLKNQKNRLYHLERSALYRGYGELAAQLCEKRKSYPKSNPKMRADLSIRRTVRLMKEGALNQMADAFHKTASEAAPDKAREMVRNVLNELRGMRLLTSPVPENSSGGRQRERFISLLHYNSQRARDLGLKDLANKLEARIFQIKGVVVQDDQLMFERTAERVKLLKANQQWLKLPWYALAEKLGVTPENAQRIYRLTGLKKINAKSEQKEEVYEKFITIQAVRDVLTGAVPINYALLEQQTGLSRMTVFRFLRDAGYSPKRRRTIK